MPQAQLSFVQTRPENNSADRLKRGSTLPWLMQLAVPVATLIAFGVHLLFAKNAPPLETHSYILLFWEILGVSIVLAIAQTFWAGLRQWMRHMWPIFTAAILLLGVWDAITLGFHLLPLPYFPGPAAVLRSLISDPECALDGRVRCAIGECRCSRLWDRFQPQHGFLFRWLWRLRQSCPQQD